MELQPAGLTENIGINRVDGPQVPGVRATDRALDDPPLRAEMARAATCATDPSIDRKAVGRRNTRQRLFFSPALSDSGGRWRSARHGQPLVQTGGGRGREAECVRSSALW
jgi:hypothetical protein